MKTPKSLDEIPKKEQKIKLSKDGLLTMSTKIYQFLLYKTKSKAKTTRGKDRAVYRLIVDALTRATKASIILLFFLWGCGEAGPVGPAGPQGKQGEQGETGAQGQSGTPGTVITPIQLCPPNFVPTYPNVFPEIAFKIGNKLYGVYSANGGFMVELTPGTYSSNGINASCTFTVDADGNVSW